MDDFEDGARRSNLVFFGLKDSERDRWKQSEKLILELCSSKLSTSLDPRDIERAHRISCFETTKNRPIIFQFAHFKDKERILSLSAQLKGSDPSITADF